MTDQKFYVPCEHCQRSDNCINYLSCLNCTKVDEVLSLRTLKESPSLRVYALRALESMPKEPYFVAVDENAIRFFTRKPVYSNRVWTTGNDEDEIVTYKYDLLDGVFDTKEFLTPQDNLNYKIMCLEL